MIKTICFFLIFLSGTISAQVKTVIEYTFQDQNNYVCSSNLYVVNNESIYKINDPRESGNYKIDVENNSYYGVYNDKISRLFYSTEKNTITRIPLYNSEIIYSFDSDNLKYELTGKTKKIESYNCQEARLSLNDRKYTIWFMPEIQINFGPYKLNGLPGLIMEVTEETSNIKITFKSMKKLTETNEFDSLKKYILSKPVLDYNKYEETITELMISKKNKQIANANENGITIEFAKGQISFTTYLIDIPTNLVSKLENISQ
ncbi:GLPGLI family protein [Flavobacterium pectinovorum]|uniref:GLPGLI family protein n=1 Tax=Flavobacterium pectinovorum TaxID=29533 RepID=UPI001FAE05ED|nr:GLPGLI family protein [Flavobacterium pectinovorum]MCI9846697.1 GLPGLI family protein [Flavobacterium pectinovorum]